MKDLHLNMKYIFYWYNSKLPLSYKGKDDIKKTIAKPSISNWIWTNETRFFDSRKWVSTRGRERSEWKGYIWWKWNNSEESLPESKHKPLFVYFFTIPGLHFCVYFVCVKGTGIKESVLCFHQNVPLVKCGFFLWNNLSSCDYV